MTINPRLTTSKRRLVVLTFLILVLLFSTAYFTVGIKTKIFTKWTQGPFLGTVTSVDDVTLTIITAEGREHLVIITTDTVFKRGSEPTENDIAIGDKIAVFGSLTKDGDVLARTIRISEL